MTKKDAMSMLAVSLGSFMVTLDISIVNVALPVIQQDLNASMGDLQWIIDAYALTLSALILSAGIFSDRYGRRLIWLMGIVLFTIGSLLCAISANTTLLIIGRAIQGVGGAAVIPCAMSIILMTFSDIRIRNKMVGIWSATTAIALILGPIAGGVLVSVWGWTSIFSINIPLGFLVLGLGLYGISREQVLDRKRPMDPLGQVLAIAILAGLTYGLIHLSGNRLSTSSFVLFGAVILLVVFFIWQQAHNKAPLIPLDLFKSWAFSRYNLVSFVVGFTTYSNIFFLSLFFQNGQGYSAIETGLRMTPEFLAMGICCMTYGIYSRYLSAKRLLIVAFILIALSSLLLALVGRETSYWMIAIQLTLFGIGMGISIPAISLLLLQDAPRDRLGIISGLMNAFRQTGMTISIALLGAIMTKGAIHALNRALNMPEFRGEMVATDVIIHNIPHAEIPLTLIQDAWSIGFQYAMIGSAIAAILVLLLFIPIKRPEMKVSIK